MLMQYDPQPRSYIRNLARNRDIPEAGFGAAAAVVVDENMADAPS